MYNPNPNALPLIEQFVEKYPPNQYFNGLFKNPYAIDIIKTKIENKRPEMVSSKLLSELSENHSIGRCFIGEELGEEIVEKMTENYPKTVDSKFIIGNVNKFLGGKTNKRRTNKRRTNKRRTNKRRYHK